MQAAGFAIVVALIVTLGTCVTSGPTDTTPPALSDKADPGGSGDGSDAPQKEHGPSPDTFRLADDSELRLSGSATIGSWASVSDQIKARFEPGVDGAQVHALIAQLERAVEQGEDRDTVAIELAPHRQPEVRLEVAVASLRSGKPGMERDMREALRADAHPHVTYVLGRIKDVDWSFDEQHDRITFELTAEGKLSLAGVEKVIEMDVRIERLARDRFHVVGRRTFDMEAFDIEPPTALFGLIKADPTVEVVFDLFIEAADPSVPHTTTPPPTRSAVMTKPRYRSDATPQEAAPTDGGVAHRILKSCAPKPRLAVASRDQP